MFAIIETGGKQIKVEEGQEIFVDNLDVNEGDSIKFYKLLFVLVCLFFVFFIFLFFIYFFFFFFLYF